MTCREEKLAKHKNVTHCERKSSRIIERPSPDSMPKTSNNPCPCTICTAGVDTELKSRASRLAETSLISLSPRPAHIITMYMRTLCRFFCTTLKDACTRKAKQASKQAHPRQIRMTDTSQHTLLISSE